MAIKDDIQGIRKDFKIHQDADDRHFTALERSSNPSNAVIHALLLEFKKNTEDHFEKLNGQVGKNTAFRNKSLGGFAVISFIGLSSIVGTILLWTKFISQ